MTPLDTLITEIRTCRLCRDAPQRLPPLPHQPRPVLRLLGPAPILIAGQAPGTKVHASGLPFDDRSGDRLRSWLGVDREAFYDTARFAVVPMGFCFPGQDAKGADLPPRPECAATWHDRLFAALPPPRLAVLLGASAQRYHLARLGLARFLKPTLAATLENAEALWNASQAPRVVVLPHPSWRNTGFLKRHPAIEADLVPRLRAEVASILAATPAPALSVLQPLDQA